jgi:P-type Mg2+ transporter
LERGDMALSANATSRRPFLPFRKKTAVEGGAQPDHERLLREICLTGEEDALARLTSTPKGLSEAEAETRLHEYGPNAFATRRRHGVAADLFDRFKNPLVIQLLVIGIVSLLMHDLTSSIIVGAMIVLSVFLAFFQERKSDKAAQALQKLVQTSTVVIRDGAEVQVTVASVVPGDIVSLAAGSIIPADLRIIATKDFFVSQSALTGESMPIEKRPSFAPESGAAETIGFDNACFQGSTVVSGSARALVVNTGQRTYLGSISKNLTAAKETTAFDKGVASFVWLMVRFMVVMVLLTFFIVGITKHDWVEALLFGLSVAVGLTPEMLPMIISVCLSKGAMAMSRKKVIVKKLKAIQNFGSMDVLCTDKTGTLTQDRVVLEKHVDVTNRESVDVLRYAYMNSYYQTGLRNLLDKAILAHDDLDVEKNCRKVDEIPFDFQRKRMSVVIDHENTHVLICKGSVEDVYAACESYQIDDEIYPLMDVVKRDLFDEYRELSAQGYRVLAVAYREFPRDHEVFGVADETELILLGYVAFFDPPKDSSAAAIAALQNAGVSVKILTGDNELVTKKVCADVGLEVARVVTGPQLAAMDDAAFDAALREASVFARLSPLQKEQVISGLRTRGAIVGFLGDGINDAPAMKAADVGISVDTAVDVAKESADIILLERSLMVLEEGIIEGRKVFANIIKYIKMGASSNFGNMFSVVGGSYFLPFLPMKPIQVLANNLLYDISQTGIPTDNVDEEFLKKPHRWDMSTIRKFMIWIGPISSLFDYATYFLMLYFFGCIAFSHAGTSASLKGFYEQLFHTGWFVESLLTQTLIVHIIRTNRIPFFQSRPSVLMTVSTIAVMAIGAALPYSPFARYLGLVPLPAVYWLWIAGFLVTYSVLTHFVKSFVHRKLGV